MKNFIWIGSIIIILAALIFWGASGSPLKIPLEVGVINPVDHVKGNASSTVVITEYSDFECPACRAYYMVTKELSVEFGERVAFVFRHFPLTEIHRNSELAARAAEAAGRQGKFWEMHDLLFEKQSEWSEARDAATLFESYAELLGVTADQFRADLASKEIRDLVRAERKNALDLGLLGTPSFFVNETQIENPASIEEFRAIINEAIRRQK